MIIVEEKRLKMSFEEKRDWISYGKWMISLTPLDVTKISKYFETPEIFNFYMVSEKWRFFQNLPKNIIFDRFLKKWIVLKKPLKYLIVCEWVHTPLLAATN